LKRNQSYLFDGIRRLFSYAPGYAAVISLLSLINGFVPILQIAVTTRFVNLALQSASDGVFLSDIYLQIIFIVLLIAYTWMSSSVIKLLITKVQLILQQKYRNTILEKCARLEYRYIENADAWDLISRVTTAPEETLINNFKAALELSATIISTIGVLSFIVAQVWWAAAVIIVCCVPLFGLSIKSGKANYDASRAVAKVERRYNYLSKILSDRDSVDERTLFGYSAKLNEDYDKSYSEALRERVRLTVRWFIKTNLGGIFTALAGFIVVIVLLAPTALGTVSVGSFIAIVNAVFSLTTALSWGLSFRIDALVSGSEFLKDVEKLMGFHETPDALLAPRYGKEVKKIEFRHVSFTYPGTDSRILRDVSFILLAGKQYAFVGANGAGKTTIIKLLTGLYTNYTGDILINGKELRTYELPELKGFFSVVYQDFVRHSYSVRDTIAIGNVKLLEDSDNQLIIEKALDMSELRDTVASLPSGLDTMLGKIHENGVDLSGGQWQRLAITRAVISPAPVRILDEPTAALDPISESRIYELFGKISKEALTIFISHRLGSTRIADEIIVFDDGKVREQGTYEKLMAAKGLYCDMFEQQRSWYQ